MTAEHDKKFFDTFLMVLGVLVVIAVGIYILSKVIASNTQEKHVLADPAVRAALTERIEPAGKVAVAGEDNSALAADQSAGQAPAAASPDLPGEEVYNMACVACHGAGVAGAPKFGDAAAWTQRIAQGEGTLNKHAIEGFQGDTGFMPPKGGRVDLSDQSVINAVEYMVAGSQ